MDFDEYYEATELGRRERALGWATAIGLQDVDGLKPSKYLIKTARRDIEGEITGDEARRLVDEYYEVKGEHVPNDLFAKKSFYFRNALVRANYENQKLNVGKTQLPLEEFFRVLAFGEEIELHNRFLKIGQEYGSPAANAIAHLHRHAEAGNDVVNDGIKFSASEEKAIKLLLRDSCLSAARLGEALGVKPRQAQRVLASLKVKAGLKRRGSDKAGEWYFERLKKFPWGPH